MRSLRGTESCRVVEGEMVATGGCVWSGGRDWGFVLGIVVKWTSVGLELSRESPEEMRRKCLVLWHQLHNNVLLLRSSHIE